MRLPSRSTGVLFIMMGRPMIGSQSSETRGGIGRNSFALAAASCHLPVIAMARARTNRRAFTLVEVAMTLVIIGIAAVMVMPKASVAMAHSRVNRAAIVVAGDLELAFSLAGRQRKPVQLDFDLTNHSYTITDRASAKLLFKRVLTQDRTYALGSLGATASSVQIFPNGLASGPDTVTVGEAPPGAYSRRIAMSRTGQVRVLP